MALQVTVAAEITHSTVHARHAGLTWSQATLCCTPVWALPGKALLLCWGYTVVASRSRSCEGILWLHYGRVMAAASAKREAVSRQPCQQEKINLSGVPATPQVFSSLLTRALPFLGSVRTMWALRTVWAMLAVRAAGQSASRTALAIHCVSPPGLCIQHGPEAGHRPGGGSPFQ